MFLKKGRVERMKKFLVFFVVMFGIACSAMAAGFGI